ncbi:hypothetical protein D3C75_1198960 [compost metagenome]
MQKELSHRQAKLRVRTALFLFAVRLWGGMDALNTELFYNEKVFLNIRDDIRRRSGMWTHWYFWEPETPWACPGYIAAVRLVWRREAPEPTPGCVPPCL